MIIQLPRMSSEMGAGAVGEGPPPDVSTALEFDTKSLLLSSPAERDFP